jgi:origin recognition complex subunit 2
VRLVATADHANAPLLWDKRATALFAWRWVDATTFAPPAAADAARAPTLLAGGGGGGAGDDGGLAAALAVLGALVPNARAVFCLLAEAQLAALDAAREATGAGGAGGGRGGGAGGLDAAGGVPFDHLFRAARERFVAPSEPALRAHLAEFRDHGLLVARRSAGGGGSAAQQGGDELAVPLAAEVLARVLDEMSAAGVA